MPTASFTPRGPFSLAASIRYLEGFTPASYDHAGDDVLRMAFPADDAHHVIGCALRQKAAAGRPAAVHAEFTLHSDDSPAPTAATAAQDAARAQIARILSLDVDGTGFPALAEHDRVVASLQADYPGLRPVCFYSPYEAAAWTVIGNRIRRTQAAAIKARIARDHGQAIDVAGQNVSAFPTPAVLRTLEHIPGLTEIKIERLHAIAEAAPEGRLDAAALRAQEPEQALQDLQQLPGIGPFSAELILIRGAGHPDVFPTAEPRVHRAMATEYRLGDEAADDHGRLAGIAEDWCPYRSWVALLLRVRAQDQVTEHHGRSSHREHHGEQPHSA
ncbi:DNA-3-methyladenine glycosylase family protein [Phaeacidiphilus oryzae]|uniref:DNA-3-methyladenine glycosylase family protein n=1 Tax=Phaeacidiphilus oryzae TaxID=348818 RepID=UPI00068E5178|nr:Fe-S cluster assembly protein HesB [Phaeacidiphilus oryzae]